MRKRLSGPATTVNQKITSAVFVPHLLHCDWTSENWRFRRTSGLTMLISEIVSMLAMSRLIPTVTGPSRNKEQTIHKCAVCSILTHDIVASTA